jgi:hypothetical protein
MFSEENVASIFTVQECGKQNQHEAGSSFNPEDGGDIRMTIQRNIPEDITLCHFHFTRKRRETNNEILTEKLNHGCEDVIHNSFCKMLLLCEHRILLTILKIATFWDITPCSPLKVNRRFEGTYRLQLQGRKISRAKHKLETGGRIWRWKRYIPPKHRLTFNGTTQRYSPEDRTLHNHDYILIS